MIFPVFPGTVPQIFMKRFRKIASSGKTNLIADLCNRQICRQQKFHPPAQAVIGQIGIGRLVDELPENGAAACLSNPSGPNDVGKADPFSIVLLDVCDHRGLDGGACYGSGDMDRSCAGNPKIKSDMGIKTFAQSSEANEAVSALYGLQSTFLHFGIFGKQ